MEALLKGGNVLLLGYTQGVMLINVALSMIAVFESLAVNRPMTVPGGASSKMAEPTKEMLRGGTLRSSRATTMARAGSLRQRICSCGVSEGT